MAARALDVVKMPARIAKLPRNPVGYPIPWFVADLPDGTCDLRIADAYKRFTALRDDLCWVCGQRLGVFKSFVIGPMCAVNRITAEPPVHRDCGTYSARVCPFLSTPGMRRRPLAEDAGTVDPGGKMLTANPGVTLLWTTLQFQPFRPQLGTDGILFRLGEPTETVWFRSGQYATRQEVLDAIDAGLPKLRDACQLDDDPAASAKELQDAIDVAMRLVPA